MALLHILAIVAVAASAAAIDPLLAPLVDSAYVADGIISLPYGQIDEPVRVFYDPKGGRSRSDYYGGQDVYIYRSDMNTMLQIVPEYTDSQRTACFQTNGTAQNKIAIQSLFPDLSKFKREAEEVMVHGIKCTFFSYKEVDETRENQYGFFVSVATKQPVLFRMHGYDQLFGSHYDDYEIQYIYVNMTTPDASVFNPPPALQCGNFPGPGLEQRHPRGGLAILDAEEPQVVDEHFKSFKTAFGKSYEGSEHQKRLHNFKHNVRYVHSQNRRNLGFKLKVNHLADLHEHEFKAMRGTWSSKSLAQYEAELQHKPAAEELAALPASLDWRDEGAVSYVKDQGICGSCWSFSSTEAVEGQYFLKYKQMIPLSQQALMDCSWGFGNNACDGGEAERAYNWMLSGHGLPTQASYGLYEMADGVCHLDKAAAIEPPVRITSYLNVTAGVETVRTQLAKAPLAVAIDASHLSFAFYSSGVYYEKDCGNTPAALDHAVLAVGYGTDPKGGDYWIVKNSWSTNWGDEGYVKMSTKDNNCGVATDANLPTVA